MRLKLITTIHFLLLKILVLKINHQRTQRLRIMIKINSFIISIQQNYATIVPFKMKTLNFSLYFH